MDGMIFKNSKFGIIIINIPDTINFKFGLKIKAIDNSATINQRIGKTEIAFK